MVFSKRQSKELSQTAVKDLQAGGDITIESITQQINYYSSEDEIEFVEREDLHEFQAPRFPNLDKIDEFIEKILEQKVLLLGGNHVDKSDLAWHLASSLKHKIPSNSIKYSVYECSRNSDKRGLINAIDDALKEGVFKSYPILVLIHLNPQDVELKKLQEISEKSDIFIIATTEAPLKSWIYFDFQRDSTWIELKKDEYLYSQESLSNLVFYKLGENLILDENVRTDITQLVSKKINTVGEVNTFVHYLLTSKIEVSPCLINEAIQATDEDSKARLTKWFSSLAMREQLLVIGITLFDGLYIDQFFAALERVVKHVWQQRDASLQALDHCDLDSLGTYFEFSEVAKNNDFILKRINVKYPDEGEKILAIAWESHRRQIITAIEEIVQIIKDSAHENLVDPSDWQIYGDESLRERLYETTSSSFANIGLIAPEATSTVRNLLLSLASDDMFQSQNVAARVLAYWYKREPENFFKTIQSFDTNSSKKGYQQKGAESITQKDYIGATVAIAISYASLNDLPNQLNTDIITWLEKLSENPSPVVQAYFGNHTLAYVIPRHFSCVKSVLTKITQHKSNFSFAIAKSLANSYENNPDEILDYLKLLLDGNKKVDVKQSKINSNVRAILTPRERLISTVARAYGLLDRDVTDSFKVVQEIFHENHPIIRSATVEALSNLLEKEPKVVEPLLHSLINEFTKSDRNQLVSSLTRIYLKERAELPSGEDYCEINQQRYPVWLSGDRPLTKIETVMREWIQLKNDKVAQQIAIQASIRFADALDLTEETELTKIRKMKSLSLDQDGVWKIDRSKPWTEHWLSPAIAWVATNYQLIYRSSVQNILPEALANHSRHKQETKFVLRKWKNLPENSGANARGSLELRTTARLLDRSLWISSNQVFIGLLILGIIGSSFWVLHTVGSFTVAKFQEFVAYRDNQLITIDGLLPVDAGLNIDDVDSKNFKELKVQFTENATLDDFISVRDEGRNSGQIRVKGIQMFGSILGYELIYNDRNIGSFKEGNGKTPLVIKLNDNVDKDAMNAILRNISYKNNAKVLVVGGRSIQFELSDSSGAASKPTTRNIHVVNQNQPPEIKVADSSLNSIIKEGTVQEYRNIMINDSDSQNVLVTFTAKNGTIEIIKEENPKEEKPKEDKSKEEKPKEEKSKEDKPKEEKSKEEKSKEDKSKEDKSKEEKSKEDKSKEDKSKEEKSKEDKSKEEKSKEEKSKEDKFKEEKSKEEKSKEENKPKETTLKITKRENKQVSVGGSLEEVKTFLSKSSIIRYKPEEKFYDGEDSIVITAKDDGSAVAKNTSLIYPQKLGDSQTSEKNLSVKVQPKKYPPTISKPESLSIDEDQPLYVSGLSIKNQESKDLNEKIIVTLTVKNGKLTLMSNISQGLSEKEINANNSSRVTLEGSIASINKVLSTPNGILYQGNKDYFGSDNLTITIDKERSKPVDIPITVNPVNDPPEFIAKIAQSLGITPPPVPISEPKSDQPNAVEKTSQLSPSVPNKNAGNTNATIVGDPGNKNIRSAPGPNSPIKFTAPTGTRIRILDSGIDSEGYPWYRVSFPDSATDGWIGGHLVTRD